MEREETRCPSAARSISAELKKRRAEIDAPASIEPGRILEVPTPHTRSTLRLDARDGSGFGVVAGRVVRGGKESWP
jgi:hypothetical protein